MAALPNDKITTTLVANTLVVGSRDVGALCSHTSINPWSRYKPVNFESPSISGITRDALSGFVINSRVLVYDKPTGGANSPYRLGDFRGYNHTARRPANINKTQNFLAQYDGDTHGGSTNAVSISVILPNTEVMNLLKTQYGITHCSIYDTNDIFVGSSRMALNSLTESNYQLNSSANVNLESTPVGGTYNKTFKIWYGNINDYRMFSIPGGDTITVTGKVLARGVRFQTAILPTDSFIPYSITGGIQVTSTFDAANEKVTIDYIRIAGAAKNAQDTYKNSLMYGNFNAKVNWQLQYQVSVNGVITVPYTLVPNWYNLNAYSTQPIDLMYSMGSYEVINGSQMEVTNVPHGSIITFRLTYTSLNW